ncbi:ba82bcd6-376c-48e5-b6a6-64666b84ae8c, partial [Thermothielavioides terrestris]
MRTTPMASLPSSLPRRESTRATDRTDALWAEMQATLEAVELSSSERSGGAARVFGPDHERKLEQLRAAQIALAQAWARSEADEAIETTAAAG